MKEVKDLNIDVGYCGQSCIEFDWSANIGFGELAIFERANKWYADTETLCTNEDKEFIRMVLNKWVDDIKVVG